MYANLEALFPSIVEDMISYRENGPFELIVELSNGQCVAYDHIEQTIRYLPINHKDGMTEEDYRNEFGIRLRKIMYRKGISQTELADSIGSTQTQISHYMTGRSTPSSYKLYKIARALDCSIEELNCVR